MVKVVEQINVGGYMPKNLLFIVFPTMVKDLISKVKLMVESSAHNSLRVRVSWSLYNWMVEIILLGLGSMIGRVSRALAGNSP